jgi:hypothetical protein
VDIFQMVLLVLQVCLSENLFAAWSSVVFQTALADCKSNFLQTWHTKLFLFKTCDLVQLLGRFCFSWDNARLCGVVMVMPVDSFVFNQSSYQIFF